MRDRFSDDRLREASASLAERAQPTDACPTPEEIWDASEGASVDRVREVVLHTIDCAACAESWRLAQAVRQEARVERARERRRPSRWVVAAASIAAALIVTAGLWQLRPTPEREPAALRAPEPTATVTSTVDETRPLTRDAVLLRWDGPPAARYDVRVTTSDLRTLHEVEGQTERRLLVPVEALADVPDGARLVWVVTAHLPDGQTVEGAFFAQLASTR